MSKYQPNSYHLTLFNKIGSRLDVINHVNVTEATEAGKKHKADTGGSYAISHILINSEIPFDKHDYNQWKKRME